jgi:hypothetical protein
MTENIRERIIAKTLGMKEKPQETINDVKQQAENMSVIHQSLETAKELAGTPALEKELERKDKKMEQLERDKDKATEQAHAAEIQNVRTELGSKIDHLAESLKGGASQKSIADQISEIKKAATELGMGSSKISEIQEMMTLIDRLNPRKNLAEQVKEARELLASFQPEKNADVSIEGVPASVAIELKRMDNDVKLRLEEMADARQRSDQEFQLTLKKWDEERTMRREEIASKITVERERNQLLADGLQIIGRAGGKAIFDAAREGSGAGVSRSTGPGAAGTQGAQTPSYHIELAEGEAAKFECPHCKSPIVVVPTSTLAHCLGCNAQFPITRVAAGATPEPEPPEE